MPLTARSHCRGSKAGFTLTDLLVVMLVAVSLFGLHLTAIAANRGRAHVAQCASNLRQYAMALHLFANENQGNLPVVTTGNWAWDTPWELGGFIESTGVKWTALYCPGTSYRFSQADNVVLYNFAPGGFRVFGYVHTFRNGLTIATNWNETLNPPQVRIGFNTFTRPLPTQRVLVADANITLPTQFNPALRYTYNYTNIQGGLTKAHLSPHLDGPVPAGANLTMLDGHVEWREFEKMFPRTSNTGAPVFWW